jgi:hypothetical protein
VAAGRDAGRVHRRAEDGDQLGQGLDQGGQVFRRGRLGPAGGRLDRGAGGADELRAAGPEPEPVAADRAPGPALRAELAGSAPAPLEQLLAERVVACWLFLYYAENIMAQGLKSSMEWCEFHQRRLDHAHKRYLSALRTLAQVRKLALPVLQVNIARKQVNIAGPTAVEDDPGL